MTYHGNLEGPTMTPLPILLLKLLGTKHSVVGIVASVWAIAVAAIGQLDAVDQWAALGLTGAFTIAGSLGLIKLIFGGLEKVTHDRASWESMTAKYNAALEARDEDRRQHNADLDAERSARFDVERNLTAVSIAAAEARARSQAAELLVAELRAALDQE